MAEPAQEPSPWSLVAANAISLGIAWLNGWTMAELAALYWVHSVLIGLSYNWRIQRLDRYSFTDFEVDMERAGLTPSLRNSQTRMSMFIFGVVHLGYLAWILSAAGDGARFGAWFLACVLVLAVDQLRWIRAACRVDRQGVPNLSRLMFAPFLRAVPMHFMTLFALYGNWGLLLAGVLKTAIDIAMQRMETAELDRILRNGRVVPPEDAGSANAS